MNRPELTVAAALRARFGPPPSVAFVLGSGLSTAAEELEDADESPAVSLGLPEPSVWGHPGTVRVGRLGATRAAVFMGRVHSYECADGNLEPVVRGVRAMAVWGVKAVIMTASVGSVRPELPVGGFVRITDHLSLSGHGPLAGTHEPARGPRFVDLTNAYDPELGARLDRAAAALSLDWTTGIYAYRRGPAYETPAEVRALGMLGADVVGMSTAPEVVALRQLGVRCGAVAVVSNPGAGLVNEDIDHSSVLVEAAHRGRALGKVFRAAFGDAQAD